MFFQFRRFTLKVLLLILIVSGIYNLYTNYNGDFCVETNNRLILKEELLDPMFCIRNFSNALSLQNKLLNPDAIAKQQTLNLLTVIVLMLYFQKFRFSQRKLAMRINAQRITPSDYTCKISNIPLGQGKEIAQELHDFLKTNGLPNGRELNIQRIVLTYNVKEKIQIEKMIDKLTRKKRKEESRKQKGRPYVIDPKLLDEQIRECELKKRTLSEEFARGHSECFTGTAFVTVNTQKGTHQCL
mgnify:FL=1